MRVLIDQHRADAAAGLRTATLASGYPGSPLAGLDRELERLGPLAAEHDIVLRRAVNEELAATAVYGSQLAGTLPGPRFDGVVGVWFGKAPGLDRSTDAIRHGNHIGTDRRGGVLALCGDDPGCVSSTVPSASEQLLSALHVPTFVPGSVQEVLDLGRHAIACSRAQRPVVGAEGRHERRRRRRHGAGRPRARDAADAAARMGGRALRPRALADAASAPRARDGAHDGRSPHRARAPLRRA